jgi:predicted dienelactone hydrolase
VGKERLTFVDRTRTVSVPGQPTRPRALTTIIRYPAQGPAGQIDITDAAPERAAGPFPLIVFGHGFAVTPATYFRLLRAWAQAGYVVAAPLFPLENANAPGGPDESDLVNQPRDMSVVISGMLARQHPGARRLAAGRRSAVEKRVLTAGVKDSQLVEPDVDGRDDALGPETRTVDVVHLDR